MEKYAGVASGSKTALLAGGRGGQMTNGDKIRAMSDEELAWELMVWRCEAVSKHHGVESKYPDTQQTILKWLQQSTEEDT